MEKMTYVVALNAAIECEALSTEVREKLKALREAQMKHSSGERKPSPNQAENQGFKVDILTLLTDGRAYTISEIMSAVPSLAEKGISNQRVSAIMRMMVADGQVARQEIKRKAYFYKA